jgi:5'-methylthioadenosine phosphorylase
MSERVIGVIGGSGIYDLEGLTDVREVEVETPFGAPSDKYVTGKLGDCKMVFLSRHGRGHRILPHEINYRANLFGMKKLGVEWLISLSAVGSMKEEIRPGDIVIVDQFIDRTTGRHTTFFGEGIAGHVGMGDPISPVLSGILYDCAVSEVSEAGGGERVHRGGTYVVINGPQFSTRAESNVYRQWGVSVIGMTNMPEAKLAREAEISFATIALATDYDCWHEGEDDVTVEAVIAIVRKNAALARRILTRAIGQIPEKHECVAANALQDAIMTDPAAIPKERAEALSPILGKYL